MTPSPREVTRLLMDWSAGNDAALDQLIPLVYDELRRLARRHLARERPDHTLQSAALVNEAYLRLIDQRNVRWQNRAQFLAVSAQVMRRILVDHARSHKCTKRGGGGYKVPLDEVAIVSPEQAEEIVALDDALVSLAAIDPRKSEVVALRFFGGLSVEETADALKVSPRTVMRDLRLAKAWLHRTIRYGIQSAATSEAGDTDAVNPPARGH